MPRGRLPAPSAPPRDSARTAALRLLSRRDLTRAELTVRLLERGYPPSDVDTVVSQLVADRSVDDQRAALSHVRLASRVKGRGRLRIRRELEARGITRDVAQSAVGELSADDDLKTIRRYLEKKRVGAGSPPSERRRVFQQLVRRGFPADAIAKALRMDDDDEQS
jgi:regulatory protein